MAEREAEIIVYGAGWCRASGRARQLLDEHQIPYQWIDIDRDRKARKYVEEVNNGFRSVPTILFPDGSILVEPSPAELERKLGLTE